MQRLKILLLYKYYFLVVLLFILYICYMAFGFNYKSKYNNESQIYGKIIDYKIKEDKVTLTIKGKEKVIASYYFQNIEDIKNIKYGNYIFAKGKMNDPKNNTIPGAFNYKKYLYYHKIYHIFYIDNYKIIKSNNILYEFKNLVYERVNKLKSKKYINALVLGNKNYLDEEELNSIKSNGIMHLFAISGMHVSLLIGIINNLLKRFNKSFKSTLILIIVFLYAFLVGFMPSILRVFISLIINFLLNILKINITKISKLLICLLIMLVINPLYLFDLGFIYSFVLVFFLTYYKTNSYIKTCTLTFLISVPITIYNFYEINILSLAINIIAIPIVSYLIFPFSFLTLFITKMDKVLYYLFKLFINLNIAISKVNIFKIISGKPTLFLIVSLYILVILMKYNKMHIKFLVINILLILITRYLSFYYQVMFFDVKQGDSSLITTPFNKKVTLIDTGGIVSFNKNTYKVSNDIILYLKSRGISKITNLILTHGDYDHMGEAINLVNNFKVEKVIFNCGEFNDLEKELINVLNKKKIKYYSCINNIDNLTFLQTRLYNNENDNSNVIYTEINGYKFMFMGDAGIAKEKDILDKYSISNADVLKVGHHGSKTSSSKEFIYKINPKYSIISVGKNNRYGHPNKEVLNTLSNSKIYRTDQDGSIMFTVKRYKLKMKSNF